MKLGERRKYFQIERNQYIHGHSRYFIDLKQPSSPIQTFVVELQEQTRKQKLSLSQMERQQSQIYQFHVYSQENSPKRCQYSQYSIYSLPVNLCDYEECIQELSPDRLEMYEYMSVDSEQY